MYLFDYLFQGSRPGKKIRYVVSGSARDYRITYKCSGENKAVSREGANKGWKHSFTAKPGEYFYLSAQANDRNAEVELRIYQNGKLFKRMLKEGDYPHIYTSGVLS